MRSGLLRAVVKSAAILGLLTLLGPDPVASEIIAALARRIALPRPFHIVCEADAFRKAATE
jgi:hypothetical protein